MLAPPADNCLFTADRTGPFLSGGGVDPLSSRYFAAALFESRIIAPEGRESLRSIAIQGANVSLEVAPTSLSDRTSGQTTTTGAATLAEYQILFSANVEPLGLAVAGFDLIPVDVMLSIRATIANLSANQVGSVDTVATITAFGDYYGDRIEATPFQYPVTVTTAIRFDLGACPLDPAVVTLPEPTNGCSSFQDTSVFCCLEGGMEVCPPTFSAPP